jgi:hypothetical protein
MSSGRCGAHACAALALAVVLALAPRAARAQAGAFVEPPPPPVAASDSTRLERASWLFRYHHYEEAAALIASADSSGPAPRAPELELLGRCDVRLGEVERAAGVFTRLLDVAPAWRSDPHVLADDERAVFNRARGDWRSAHPDYVRREAALAAALAASRKPWYRQHRVQAGGALATAAVVAIVHHQHQVGQSDALPDLPGHP